MARADFGGTIDKIKKEVRYLSVSSITNFDPSQYGGCNRKWYFEKCLGYESPKTAALEIGSAVHEQIESHLITGEDTLGMIIRPGKHFIPAPKTVAPGLLVEHEFGGGTLYQPAWAPYVEEMRKTRARKQPLNLPLGTPLPVGVSAEDAKGETEEEYEAALKSRTFVKLFEHWRDTTAAVAAGTLAQDKADAWYRAMFPFPTIVAHGIPFVGYIDAINERDYWLSSDGESHYMPPTCAEVIDWKTTSNIASYAKSHLEETVQMTGYAEWMTRRNPSLTHVRLSHGYFQTRGRAAEKRTVLITVDTAHRKWEHIQEQVRRMAQVVRETDVANVEPNYDACDSYGRLGCPHKAICPRDNEQTLVDFIGERGMSSMLDFFGDPAGDAPSAPVVTPAPAPQAHAAPPAADVAAARASLLAMEVAAKPVAVTAPVITSSPAVSAVATQRVLVKLENRMVLVHRTNGYKVQFFMTRDADTGISFWSQAAVNADGTTGDVASTKPEQWYTDVWEVVVPPAPVVARAPTAANPVPVAPPDMPASVPPHNAVSVPPGTALSPAVAAAVEQWTAHSALPPVPSAGLATSATVTAGVAADVPVGTASAMTTSPEVKRRPKKSADNLAQVDTSGPFTLFINCSTVTFQVTDLEEYVYNITMRLAEAAKLTDIRMAGQEHNFAFGKWKAALTAAVRALPPTGYCSLRTDKDEIKEVVANALRPLARAAGGLVEGLV